MTMESVDWLDHLEHYSTERDCRFVDRTEKHSELKLNGKNRHLKPLPLDRTLNSLSNGMYNSILTKMSLRTL